MFEYRAKTPATPLCRRCDSAVGEVTGRSKFPQAGASAELADCVPAEAGTKTLRKPVISFLLQQRRPYVCIVRKRRMQTHGVVFIITKKRQKSKRHALFCR
jgi:hypothetical protein